MEEQYPGLYEDVVSFVNEAFNGKNIKHFDRVVYWMEQLKPDLPLAFKIAGYSHDIERGFREVEGRIVPNGDYCADDWLTIHQNRGAEIMREFLEKKSVDEEVISTVERLIQRHEWGGDNDQDLIMHADSISFFETNAEKFVTEKVKNEGIDKIRAKLDWMYERMTNPHWKKHATSLYSKWMGQLDEINPSLS